MKRCCGGGGGTGRKVLYPRSEKEDGTLLMMCLLVMEFLGMRKIVSTLVAFILSTSNLVQQYDSNNAKT
jgi:hypothetical protein